MAFINEYISEADVTKYGLDEFIKSWQGGDFAWRNGRPSSFRHSWTIDRDRDAYLLCMGMISEVGLSGRPEPRPPTHFVLFLRGTQYRVLLEPFTNSDNIHHKPFRKVWCLMHFDSPRDSVETRDHVLCLLKEALLIYGHAGVWSQIPDLIVDFKF